MSGADLTRAILIEADLAGTKLGSAKLNGANLEDAKNLSQKQLDEACGEATRLPEGLAIGPCPAEQESLGAYKPSPK